MSQHSYSNCPGVHAVYAYATGFGMITDRLQNSLQSIDKTPGLSLHTLDFLPLSAAHNIEDTNNHSKTNRTRNTDLL